jgi:hypothetical protein
MKWKRTLTAEQAALIAVGLDLETDLIKSFSQANEEYEEAAPITDKDGILLSRVSNIYKRYHLLKEALDIYEALMEEIYLSDAFERGESDLSSVIKIAIRVAAHEYAYDIIVPEKTQISKESVAEWFIDNGDSEKANRLIPNLTKKYEESLLSFNELKELREQLETANKEVEVLNRKLGFKNQDFDEEQFQSSLSDYEKQHRLTSIDMPTGFTESIDVLKTENSALKEDLANLKLSESVAENHQQKDLNDASMFLPVNGNEMTILSKAWQNFPTKFEYYKKRIYTKKIVMEWLDKSYGCNARQQDVFANILKQNFVPKL